MNDAVIRQLQKIRDHYQDQNDQGRKIAYNKVIGFLQDFDKPIEDVNDLEDLPNIGENIKEHIKEFLETGTVKEFEDKQGSTEGSGQQQEKQTQNRQT